METISAWIWSIALSLQIASAITGGTPTWTSVFCPLIVVVIHSWINVYLKKEKNK